jgi:hypothetical protein
MASKKRIKRVKPEDKVETIFIRDVSEKDNVMLLKLQEIFGRKAATGNVMRASHGFIEQLEEINKLRETIRGLENLIEEFYSMFHLEEQQEKIERDIIALRKNILRKVNENYNIG